MYINETFAWVILLVLHNFIEEIYLINTIEI